VAPPRLSIHLTNWHTDPAPDWGPLFARAEAADEAGVDRVIVSDHVIMGEHLEEYARPEVGGQVGGRQPTGPDGAWLEPLTLLAMVAARTTRVRLQTGVLLAALRRPVVLAKTAATIDALSGGRLDLGVGVGWQREEYEAAGLSFAERGALLDHTLAVCQALWRGETSFRDERLSFEGVHLSPRPTHPDGVPVWVSGTLQPRALARIVRFGRGWVPWGPDAELDRLPDAVARVHDALREAGRDPAGFEVTANLPVRKDAQGRLDLAATVAPTPALAEAGVTNCTVRLQTSPERAAAAEELGALVAAFRAAVG